VTATDDLDLSACLDFAVDLALDAGAVLRAYFGGSLMVETKSSEIDPVTDADRASEALILERLRHHFPDHAILAEESGHQEGTHFTWLVDPLDGTVNFAHGLPHYAVSIALYRGRTGLVGVIYEPERDELFWAVRGRGAWLRRRRERRLYRLHVSDARRLRESIIATGFHYLRETLDRNNIAEFSEIVMRAQGIRRAGSAALDLAYVAAGRLDGYWEYYMSPWDIGAGGLIVQEAGGILRTVEGEAWDPWQTSTVASGPALMPLFLEALRRAREA